MERRFSRFVSEDRLSWHSLDLNYYFFTTALSAVFCFFVAGTEVYFLNFPFDGKLDRSIVSFEAARCLLKQNICELLYLLAPLKGWIARSPSSIMLQSTLRGESTLSTAVKPTAWLHPEF